MKIHGLRGHYTTSKMSTKRLLEYLFGGLFSGKSKYKRMANLAKRHLNRNPCIKGTFKECLLEMKKRKDYNEYLMEVQWNDHMCR